METFIAVCIVLFGNIHSCLHCFIWNVLKLSGGIHLISSNIGNNFFITP